MHPRGYRLTTYYVTATTGYLWLRHLREQVGSGMGGDGGGWITEEAAMVSPAPSDLYVEGSRHSLVHCEVLYMLYRCDGR